MPPTQKRSQFTEPWPWKDSPPSPVHLIQLITHELHCAFEDQNPYIKIQNSVARADDRKKQSTPTRTQNELVSGGNLHKAPR